ncbi:MAG: hypothetical protein A2X32_00695 [Elusimicrobia bacterium GWC2_64_44]|nr:MAG: hypothetical protein A2X32_00695 [Elusimicrobia bacterium GWC2_64_44]
MKLLLALLLLPAFAGAAELESLRASDVAASAPQAPAAGDARYADGTLSGLRLMALTGPKLLYTQMAGTPEQFAEFTAAWTPVITKAGLKPLPPEFSPGFGALKYEPTGGLAIRSFLCDTAHMPLPPAQMEKKLSAALRAAGLRVVGSFGVPTDDNIFPKPTVNLYYLTALGENQDREKQLRYMSVRHSAVRLDFALLEGAGIKFVARYGENAAFYIGPRVGVTLAVAKDPAIIPGQEAYYRDLIKKRGETLIGVKTDRLDQPVTSGGEQYSYLTKIYYLK